MEYEIVWTEEGDGWNGQWRETGLDGAFGNVGDLTVEPEGGFHGAWCWKVRTDGGAEGSCYDFDRAFRVAELVFHALLEAAEEAAEEEWADGEANEDEAVPEDEGG